MQQFSSNSSRSDSSLLHLLLVWFLVGSSFFGLGWDIADVVPVSIPLSSMEAGLLFGTVVVSLLWTAGFRPPISASGGYFIAEMGLHFLVVLGASLFLLAEGPLSPWHEVVSRSLSVGLAAGLVFTTPGRRIRRYVWVLGRKFVKTPQKRNR